MPAALQNHGKAAAWKTSVAHVQKQSKLLLFFAVTEILPTKRPRFGVQKRTPKWRPLIQSQFDLLARALYYNARRRLGCRSGPPLQCALPPRDLYNARCRLGAARALYYNARYRSGPLSQCAVPPRHRFGAARALYYNARTLRTTPCSWWECTLKTLFMTGTPECRIRPGQKEPTLVVPLTRLWDKLSRFPPFCS